MERSTTSTAGWVAVALTFSSDDEHGFAYSLARWEHVARRHLPVQAKALEEACALLQVTD